MTRSVFWSPNPGDPLAESGVLAGGSEFLNEGLELQPGGVPVFPVELGEDIGEQTKLVDTGCQPVRRRSLGTCQFILLFQKSHQQERLQGPQEPGPVQQGRDRLR